MSGSIAGIALAGGLVAGGVGYGAGPSIDNAFQVTSYKQYSYAYNQCEVGGLSYPFEVCKNAIDSLPDAIDIGFDAAKGLNEAVQELREARAASKAAAEKGYGLGAAALGAGGAGGAAAVVAAKKRKQ